MGGGDRHGAWRGAAVLASSPAFASRAVTKEQYMDLGAEFCSTHFGFEEGDDDSS